MRNLGSETGNQETRIDREALRPRMARKGGKKENQNTKQAGSGEIRKPKKEERSGEKPRG
jgi:hypothetical protein